MSGIHMAESQISIMDGKLEKRFQKCREGNKKIELVCFTDSKTSIFPC